MKKKIKEKKKNSSSISKTSANIMSRYLLAKTCRANGVPYKEVRKMGITNHIYSKAAKKKSPVITLKKKCWTAK